jgi:hypothetical protein
MARVCFPMLFLLMLTARASDQASLVSNKQQPNFPLIQAQRMLACTGLPVEGQTCLLEAPKDKTSS